MEIDVINTMLEEEALRSNVEKEIPRDGEHQRANQIALLIRNVIVLMN